MSLAFEQPVWLLLILLAVPCAVAGWLWLGAMSRARRVSAVALRTVLLTLVAMMLAGASTVHETRRLAVVAVLDVSDSVRRFGDFEAADGEHVPAEQAMRAWLASAVGSRGPEDLLGIVAVDGRALAVATPTAGDVLGRSLPGEPAQGTDLAAGLRLAAALVPPDAAGRIVLVSDGNQTGGDAAAVADELATALGDGGLPVDVVPVALRRVDEVMVESVDAPPNAAEQSSVGVRVVLRSTGPARGVLRLTREGEPVDLNGDAPGYGRPIELDAGRTVVRLPVELPPGRVHRFEAVFEPEVRDDGEAVADASAANNRATAFTLTPGRGSVLIVDGVSSAAPGGAGRTLAGAFDSSGIDVEVVAPSAMPSGLLGLEAYDLVVLQNVPAEEVPPATQEALASYVRELGGGLVMVGGPASFGAGGWNNTPVADVLPVLLDLPERLETPEAAIVFVLDSSGSMSGSVLGSSRSQQEIANEAAALAVESLDKTDLVGVISFDNAARVVRSLGPNSEPTQTAAQIRSIAPGGGTNLPPALLEARKQLEAADAKVKHVIVLSDGQSRNSEQLGPLAESMAEAGIRVSTIAVGDGADTTTLAEIATRGRGTFYEVNNPNVLPRVFLKAVRVVRSPMVRERRFDVVMPDTASPLVEGLGEPPPLDGLVLTRPRPEPGVVDAMLAPTGVPVLSHWRVGLGQVAAFTSDAHEWARRWVDWPGYATLWASIARTIGRQPGGEGTELATVRDGDAMEIRLRAFDDEGAPIDALSVPARVFRPDGEVEDVQLEQVGPGEYAARVPTMERGDHIVLVRPSRGDVRLPPALGGVSVAAGAETRSLEADAELLAGVAQRTGGRVLSLTDPGSAALFDRSSVPPREARTPVWPALLAWAVLIFLLDVGTRRVAWDRLLSREHGADLRADMAEAVRDRTQAAAAAVGALRGSRTSKADEQAAGAPSIPKIAKPRTLGDDDAAKLAREQQVRRQRAELDRLRAMRAEAKKQAAEVDVPQQPSSRSSRTPAPSEAPKPKPTGEPPADESASGLLAAKKRARQRYGQDDGAAG